MAGKPILKRYLRRKVKKRFLSPEEAIVKKKEILADFEQNLNLADLRLIQAIAPYLNYIVDEIEIDLLITSYIESKLFDSKNEHIKNIVMEKFELNFPFKLRLFCKLYNKNQDFLDAFNKVALAKHQFRNKLVHYLFFRAHQKSKEIQEIETETKSKISARDLEKYILILGELRKQQEIIKPLLLSTELFSGIKLTEDDIRKFTDGLNPVASVLGGLKLKFKDIR